MPKRQRSTKRARTSKKTKYGLYRTGGFPATSAKRPELKFVDVNPVQVGVSSTATFALLNGVAQGTGAFNRIGRLTAGKYLEVRWNGDLLAAIMPTFNPSQPVKNRVMVVIDHQANGATPQYTDVVESVPASGQSNATSTPYSLQNMANKARFTILRDEIFHSGCFNNAAGITAGGVLTPDVFSGHTRTWKIDLKGLKTTYKSVNGGISDIATNAIWLVFISDYAGAGQNLSLNYTARLRYYDI